MNVTITLEFSDFVKAIVALHFYAGEISEQESSDEPAAMRAIADRMTEAMKQSIEGGPR